MNSPRQIHPNRRIDPRTLTTSRRREIPPRLPDLPLKIPHPRDLQTAELSGALRNLRLNTASEIVGTLPALDREVQRDDHAPLEDDEAGRYENGQAIPRHLVSDRENRSNNRPGRRDQRRDQPADKDLEGPSPVRHVPLDLVELLVHRDQLRLETGDSDDAGSEEFYLDSDVLDALAESGVALLDATHSGFP